MDSRLDGSVSRPRIPGRLGSPSTNSPVFSPATATRSHFDAGKDTNNDISELEMAEMQSRQPHTQRRQISPTATAFLDHAEHDPHCTGAETGAETGTAGGVTVLVSPASATTGAMPTVTETDHRRLDGLAGHNPLASSASTNTQPSSDLDGMNDTAHASTQAATTQQQCSPTSSTDHRSDAPLRGGKAVWAGDHDCMGGVAGDGGAGGGGRNDGSGEDREAGENRVRNVHYEDEIDRRTHSDTDTELRPPMSPNRAPAPSLGLAPAHGRAASMAPGIGIPAKGVRAQHRPAASATNIPYGPLRAEMRHRRAPTFHTLGQSMRNLVGLGQAKAHLPPADKGLLESPETGMTSSDSSDGDSVPQARRGGSRRRRWGGFGTVETKLMTRQERYARSEARALMNLLATELLVTAGVVFYRIFICIEIFSCSKLPQIIVFSDLIETWILVGLLHSMFKAGRLLWPRQKDLRLQLVLRLLCVICFLGSVVGFGWLGTLPILHNSLTSPSSYEFPGLFFYGSGFIAIAAMLAVSFIAAASKWLMLAETLLLLLVLLYAYMLDVQDPLSPYEWHLHHYQMMFASLLLTRRQPKQVWLHNSLVLVRWMNMGVMIQGIAEYGTTPWLLD